MNGASAAEIFNVLLRVALGIAIVYGIMHLVRRVEEKKESPELSLDARVAHKRADGAPPVFYATFDCEDGARVELRVPAETYDLLGERDTGRLTFRGQEFVRFARTSPAHPKEEIS